MKSLERREQEVENMMSHPVRAAQSLVERVNEFCQSKQPSLYTVTAEVGFEVAIITNGTNKLTAYSPADGEWKLDTDGTIRSGLSEDEMLDAVLDFLPKR
jgi:hypothetical protein